MSDYELVYFRGDFVPAADARVSIKARALNYGLGCFEGIRAYWNEDDQRLRIFRVEDHYRRLLSSCRILQMPIALSAGQMVEITDELCRKNKVRTDTYIRPIVYDAVEAISPIMSEDGNEFAVFVQPLRDYLDTSSGITACVSSWRRTGENMIPARAKPVGGYVNSALARAEAKANGYDEAIFLTADGYVSEGSAEHIFLVRDGELITPTSQEDNLEGITRRTVLELARDLGRTVVERRVARAELYVADEIFFCGTGAEVTPVRGVDRRIVGDGAMGPVTRELQELFFKTVRGQVEKFAHWCHLV